MQRANIIMCIVVLIIAMMAAIAVGDGYTWLVVTRALLITPAYMLGAWCGARLFVIAPKTWFKKVALVILLVTGVSVLLA